MYGIGKKIKDESGMILMASTMGIFIILSLLAFYLARFSITETRSGANYIQDIKTRNLAITGAEHGMQVYKELKSTSELTGNFNKGSYTVSFDLDNDEVNTSLPFTHYLTMKSSASIDDVKRNIRYILSSFPEAFCFSFYGNNASSETFNETSSYIGGDMFFNGSVSIGSGTSNGITYISAGSGGTILSTYPEFPQIDNTLYDDLLDSASLVSGSYTNYALNFNGSNQYIEVQNNSLINTGSSHTAKTIEAWFKVDSVDFADHKQTIYEQGGTVRGLNIYIYDGLLYVGGWNEPDGESDWDPGTWLVTDADAITSGTWHHVALTLDASASGNTTNGILKGNISNEYVPFLLALFAFGIGKAALMPFHKWLPAAVVAPTPVSALLHAVAVVKAGVFSMLVVITYVFGIDFLSETNGTVWLIWISSITLLLSSCIAITKDDLKARLAYSTISQLSYIVLGGAISTNIAVQGALIHIVMHAVGKITLFFAAGAIYVATHLSKISDLNGMGKSMPLTFIAFFIGSLSIIGVPPMGGSWSKFYLMLGSVEKDYLLVIYILAISTLLNVYYLLEIPAKAFFQPKRTNTQVTKHPLTVYPTFFAAILTIILFIYIEPLKDITNLLFGN